MYSNIAQLLSNPDWLLSINVNNFEDIAFLIFAYQYQNCTIYQQYADLVHKSPKQVKRLEDIPFLPISFFKSHKVQTGQWLPEVTFESSGTTHTINSQHLVKSTDLYLKASIMGWQQFYQKPADYVFLCLLPSYLERNNSSLVYMAQELITQSKQPESGFYLDEWEMLATKLKSLEQKGQKTVLLGVTFALLDFAAAYPIPLKNTIVMETGGMKGRKAEWTRTQVHHYIKKQWQIADVHSEYGMTELLSQAYASSNGLFSSTSSMRVYVRDENDPFAISTIGSGCLNVIDLANVHTCSFIATDDIAKIHSDGQFEILGRLDHSALRGCSLMVV